MKTNEMINEALGAYGMADARFELIRHNENIMCKVDGDGGSYALRIHSPADGFCTSLITDGVGDTELFVSETELLLHLAQNGFGGLQRPVVNRDGKFVTELDGGVPAMMLTWAKGRPVTHDEFEGYAEEIGKMACRIHRAARGFTGKRIRYDNALCGRMAEEIQKAVAMKHLTEDEGGICVRELEAVRAAQRRQERLFGTAVIHADLSPGNILITDSGLVPIDFSFSGYGSLAQEAGMLMSNIRSKDGICDLLKGFESSGESVDRTDAEIFTSYSVLLFICSHHNAAFREEWFENSMKRWCGELFIHR